jgi:hypothetical protein
MHTIARAMHLMVCVWLIFAALLFVIEPLILRRAVHKRATGRLENPCCGGCLTRIRRSDT